MINIVISILEAIIQGVNAITFFLPTVTELPYGIDASLIYFVGLVKGILDSAPLLVHPFGLAILGLFVVFSLFLWHWIEWIIRVVRG